MSHNRFDIERYKEMALNLLSKLDDKVREELEVILTDAAYLHVMEISKCESPIESILLMWLRHYFQAREQEYKQWDNFPLITIEPQRTVERGKKKYRIDIALDCSFKGKKHSFAIECDGHNFHEKTKEQAARDKQRDRDLQSMEYRVLRFTGSEIWDRPSKCAYDALKIVEKITGIHDEEIAYLQKIYPDNNW